MTGHRHRTAVFAALLAAGVFAAPAQGATSSADTRAFAKHCQTQSKKRAAGLKRTAFSNCVTAMSRLARAQSRSPQIACATLSRKRAARTRTSPFNRCVTAGRRLISNGNGIDRAYLEAMIPHHVSAVEMAQLAATSAQTPFLQALAQTIITSQNAEIARMHALVARLKAAGIPSVSLGLSQGEMGMDHDMSHLVGAEPFDVHFVDMMIPHHQGAITMSRVLFAKGMGAATRQLADQINASQAREIQQMRAFRTSTTGSPAPAAGEGGGEHPH